METNYFTSESGRDISEKIALGLAKPTVSKDSMFDARLFNQTEGIGSGFKDDDGKSNSLIQRVLLIKYILS